MANIKTNMLDLRNFLRYLINGLSERKISKKMQLSRTSVHTYRVRAHASGMSNEELLKLEDKDLNAILRKKSFVKQSDARMKFLEPLLPTISKELQQKSYTHVTYELLWQEYRKKAPSGYGYTRFKAIVKAYEKSHNYVYHNTYAPGEMMQIDYAGDSLYITEIKTGAKTKVVVLCAILPYSSLTYALAMRNATSEHFYYGLSKAVDYFGGIAQIAKSDNMHQWVNKYDRYEPKLNDAAIQFGLHYGCEIETSRVRRPRDKGAVEGAVNKIYNYIYARMRKETFFSLNELNNRLLELLEEYNNRIIKLRGESRRERFLREEKALLLPLPEKPYLFKYTKDFKVNSTYHVSIGTEKHFYSIPYEYVNKKATVVYDYENVEIYINLVRVAIHRRNYTEHAYTTLEEHMPANHKAYKRTLEYNAAYFIEKAAKIGPSTKTVITRILEKALFVQQSYKSCQGLLSLSKKYGEERLEAACNRVVETSSVNYSMIKRILNNGLDRELQVEIKNESYVPTHENVRGSEAYNTTAL